MLSTQSGERLHITLFGLRNAGKSSLLNAIAGRTVAIVSEEPGTTTDPVSRPMELGALGAVVLTDTAGLDDEGELGRLRVERSLERLSWTDLALLATPLGRPTTAVEIETCRRLAEGDRPLVVVGTFADAPAEPAKEAWLASLERGEGGVRPRFVLRASGKTGEGVDELRKALASLNRAANAGTSGLAPEPGPLEGLVDRGDLVVLVTPIDSAAPRGRMILPEAAVLRDALDRGCAALVVREADLASSWPMLARRPRLVVTDSQAFAEVVAALPPDQALTSFSILFARKKGGLARFAAGLDFLARLGAEAAAQEASGLPRAPLRLLAIEACTHDRTHEDIATVKIPALLAQRSGRKVELSVVRELSDLPVKNGFDLAVICGGCMATRGRMLAQHEALAASDLPVLNFGLFLAWAHGALPRALEVFGRP
jgi:[FeFe] hydrogenase H-cluster maturation GTPase HydF